VPNIAIHARIILQNENSNAVVPLVIILLMLMETYKGRETGRGSGIEKEAPPREAAVVEETAMQLEALGLRPEAAAEGK